MRHWLFHPIIFYPLALVLAALTVLVSLEPQSWTRPPAAVAGVLADGALTLDRDDFSTPAPAPEQNLTIVRDFWGRAQALRIAQLPSRPPPGPSELGVRVLLSPAGARPLVGKAVTVEVTYNPVPINAATGLAVSLRGAGPAAWISQPAPPQPGVLSFEFPAQGDIAAIGLRALSNGADQAYGLEITRIRIIPRP